MAINDVSTGTGFEHLLVLAWRKALSRERAGTLYISRFSHTVDRGGLAPLVLELRLPFGHASFIAIGEGADGECDAPKEQSSTTVRWEGGPAPSPVSTM